MRAGGTTGAATEPRPVVCGGVQGPSWAAPSTSIEAPSNRMVRPEQQVGDAGASVPTCRPPA